MRCALVTLPRSWQPLLRRLRHAAEHHGPLSALDSSSLSLSPSFWKMDAIAALVGHAAEGFPGTQRPRVRGGPSWEAGGREALRLFGAGSLGNRPKWQRVFGSILQKQ
eukprot:8538436-Pyramimonas_sp.AAC.1